MQKKSFNKKPVETGAEFLIYHIAKILMRRLNSRVQKCQTLLIEYSLLLTYSFSYLPDIYFIFIRVSLFNSKSNILFIRLFAVSAPYSNTPKFVESPRIPLLKRKTCS